MIHCGEKAEHQRQRADVKSSQVGRRDTYRGMVIRSTGTFSLALRSHGIGALRGNNCQPRSMSATPTFQKNEMVFLPDLDVLTESIWKTMLLG